ncbi:molybdopterin-guanine dinucleotide biosynthesis protein B [candidate division KSB1 bacterium]|nr:molybdopterin-guanine dinucleotide biosynthesis protein B [candidate division KSB1 bacterium]MBL7095623.1 molybdopterin-guanine dinucleotide biosynthesis protein B [candidate division KSB1 bacterium]
MKIKHNKLLHVIGNKSNVGKTTLSEFITSEMKKRGLTVGFLKHSLHNHPLDKPGTDSFRLQQAGASPSIFYTPAGMAIVKKNHDQKQSEEFISHIFADCDLVLIESNRSADGQKIVFAESESDLEGIKNILAIISTTLKNTQHPTFSHGNEKLINFIVEKFELKNLPSV